MLSQWIQNLVYYFIFLSVILHLLPEGTERRYIRFFLGLVLLIMVLRPLLALRDADGPLEGVLGEIFSEEFANMVEEEQAALPEQKDYVKEECRKEICRNVTQLAEGYGYEVLRCEVTLFESTDLEIKNITLELAEGQDKEENAATKQDEDFIKNELQEVYNLPAGNIMVRMQGQV